MNRAKFVNLFNCTPNPGQNSPCVYTLSSQSFKNAFIVSRDLLKCKFLPYCFLHQRTFFIRFTPYSPFIPVSLLSLLTRLSKS